MTPHDEAISIARQNRIRDLVEEVRDLVKEAVQAAVNRVAARIADDESMDYEDALEAAINALAEMYDASDDDALDAIADYTREA